MLNSPNLMTPNTVNLKKYLKLAVERMNDKELDGSRLVVQIAGDRRKERNDPERKRGPQKDDVCYNC